MKRGKPLTPHQWMVAGGVLIFALGIAAGENDHSDASIQPVTKTKTVKVPGPVRIKKVAGPERVVTHTRTVTKQVTPRSCIDALSEVSALGIELQKVTSISGSYVDLIDDAYNAGAAGAGVDSLTSRMGDLTSQQSDANDTTAGIIHRYTVAARKCRAS